MQKWQSFNDSDLFVIGRMILRNANFDENGEVRQRMNVTSSSLYALARLDLLIRNRDAVEFMWTELGDNMENFCYVVGDKHDSNVRIETKESDYYYQGCELIEIESIYVEGAESTKDVAYKKTVFNAEYLRMALVSTFQIPPQLFSWNLKRNQC